MSGEFEGVCGELGSLGSRVFEEPYLADATAVAFEIVSRCAHNLSLIHTRLIGLGFQFENEVDSLVVDSIGAPKIVQQFESSMGKLPLILSAWYSRISSVDFSQASSQLFDSGSELGGLGWHVELIFQRLEKATSRWSEYIEDVKNDHEHFAKKGIMLDSAHLQPILFTGGCASNNDDKGIELPCQLFDAVIYNDGFGDIFVIDELRSCFKYAGFPVLFRYEEHKEVLRHLIPRPGIERLLPILTDGIVDI